MEGYLLFGDGSEMKGTLAGACKPTVGELVFNTSMTGYQEILTDPSYHGQIVVLTQPEIGNYGTADEVSESDIGRAAGMIFRNMSPGVWHRTSEQSFDALLASLGVTAITEVDTRVLTHRIREKGPGNVLIAPEDLPREEARNILAAAPQMKGANLVPNVSVKAPRTHGSGKTHIVLLDLGIKIATIRALTERDCRVTQVPWNTSFEEIAALEPDGIMLSNGPGDPAAIPGIPKVVGRLMETYPTMGICLGFQVMALALGGETYKLPFGHRGGNHPVRFNGRVAITSQNHGFAVQPESLDESRVELTHISLFDKTLEGFELKGKPVFGVQFHPEAAPGPHDCMDHFDYYLTLVRGAHAQA